MKLEYFNKESNNGYKQKRVIDKMRFLGSLVHYSEKLDLIISHESF
jgi:hypothetical protein